MGSKQGPGLLGNREEPLDSRQAQLDDLYSFSTMFRTRRELAFRTCITRTH